MYYFSERNFVMEVVTQTNTEIFNLPLWSAPFGQFLLDNINYNSKVETVLDIGFGGGFPLLELSQRFDAKTTFYGIDIDVNSVKKLKEIILINSIPNVIVSNESAEKIPFNDNYFDLIVSNNGINNVEDTAKAISECARVCKSSGEFIFTFNLFDTYSEFYNIFNKVLTEHKLFQEIESVLEHRNKKRPSLENIKAHLANSGFIITKIKHSNFNMCFTNGSAFFNHYFIKKYFLPDWEKPLKENEKDLIMGRVKSELNSESENKYIKFGVPFVCLQCKKVEYDNN